MNRVFLINYLAQVTINMSQHSSAEFADYIKNAKDGELWIPAVYRILHNCWGKREDLVA